MMGIKLEAETRLMTITDTRIHQTGFKYRRKKTALENLSFMDNWSILNIPWGFCIPIYLPQDVKSLVNFLLKKPGRSFRSDPHERTAGANIRKQEAARALKVRLLLQLKAR
jgi:hypothetical protein